MRKVFIEVNVVKEFPEINETKVSTASGTEIYLPSSEVIPTDPLSGGEAHEDLDLASFGGSVVINGKFLTASEVKLYLGLYEGLLRQYEDLKDVYRKAGNRKTNGWIPAEYKMPDRDGVYDVTVIDGAGKRCVVTWQFLSGKHLSGLQTYVDGKHYWANNYNGDPINPNLSENVIAWRYRPDPYRKAVEKQ